MPELQLHNLVAAMCMFATANTDFIQILQLQTCDFAAIALLFAAAETESCFAEIKRTLIFFVF